MFVTDIMPPVWFTASKHVKRWRAQEDLPSMQNKIFNSFKKCPMCKAPQPKNVRLNKKIEKFKQKKKKGCQHTKNQVTSHLWDDAIILVSNFSCSMSP